MLDQTDLPDSPWLKVASKNTNQATLRVLTNLVSTLRKRVNEVCQDVSPVPRSGLSKLPAFSNAPHLSKADLTSQLSKDYYRELLEVRQRKIQELHHEVYRLRIPVVLVYEGWDAAGKGGNIRRLTERMDPRGYEVIPVSAPNDLEKAHHYLWRFWTEFPKAGHVTIFDRSWYGRVLVERVEGFCSEAEWKQAYREINEMEENFRHFGTVMAKFWVHIDQEEQLKRFKAREQNSRKQWKLNEEDWRNREKWKPYEDAVNEMFLRTHAPKTPWTLIEGNCKRFARIKALDVVIEAIEKAISEKSR